MLCKICYNAYSASIHILVLCTYEHWFNKNPSHYRYWWSCFFSPCKLLIWAVWYLDFISSSEPKALWWVYRIGRPPLPIVRCQHFQTSSPLTPLGQLKPNFIWSSMGKGKEIFPNGHGHMTKMAAMPICGKNLKKSSSPEPKGWWPWNVVCSIGCSSTTKFVQMMTLGWLWHILRQGEIWSIMLLYG